MTRLGYMPALFRETPCADELIRSSSVKYLELFSCQVRQNIVPVGKPVCLEGNGKRTRWNIGGKAIGRSALLLPKRKTAVDQSDIRDAEVTEKPPEASGVELTPGVINENLISLLEAERCDEWLPAGGVVERSGLGRLFFHRLNVNENRTGKMRSVKIGPGSYIDETQSWFAKPPLQGVEIYKEGSWRFRGSKRHDHQAPPNHYPGNPSGM